MTASLKVLLVDDDADLASLMARFFSKHDIELREAEDGVSGIDCALRGQFDLVLLDVMLPGMDGFSVLRALRKRSAVPVIMLTARAAEQDRVQGLEQGADDFLAKPFGPAELLARIRAVIRRTRGNSGPRLVTVPIGRAVLRRDVRELICGEKRARLTETEFNVLEHLACNSGRAVSRRELMAVVHHVDLNPLDRSLDVHVSNIRRKLGEWGPRISSVRGEGYLLVESPGS